MSKVQEQQPIANDHSKNQNKSSSSQSTSCDLTFSQKRKNQMREMRYLTIENKFQKSQGTTLFSFTSSHFSSTSVIVVEVQFYIRVTFFNTCNIF